MNLHVPLVAGMGDPGLHAGATRFRIVPVGIGKVAAVELQDLDALVDRIGNGLSDPVVQVRPSKDLNRHAADLLDWIVVGVGHDPRIGLRGHDRNTASAEDRKQSGLEGVLLIQIIHPENQIVTDRIGRHVDGPDLIGEIRHRLLGQALHHEVVDGWPHADDGDLLGLVFQNSHVAVAIVAEFTNTLHLLAA